MTYDLLQEASHPKTSFCILTFEVCFFLIHFIHIYTFYSPNALDICGKGPFVLLVNVWLVR